MIDLQSFCCKADDREFTQRPFRVGDWVFATTGAILVRVPAESAPDVAPMEQVRVPTNCAALVEKWEHQPAQAVGYVPPLQPLTECRACSGTGWIEGPASTDRDPCTYCCGLGHGTSAVEIAGIPFENVYLHKIAALPNVTLRVHGPSDPMVFTFDGGVGLLMPRRK